MKILNFKMNKAMTALVKNRMRPNGFPVLFEDAFFKEFFEPVSKVSKSVPLVNVKESDKGFTLEIAAPGLKKDDFKIAVEDNLLKISSEIKSETESTEQDGKYTRKEFSYSSFSRSFTLDEQHTDIDNITASYESGVLTLNIPKRVEPEKVKKTIAIQ